MSKFRSVNKICFPIASYDCISPKEARIAPLEPTRIAPFNAELQTTMAKQCASVCPFPEAWKFHTKIAFWALELEWCQVTIANVPAVFDALHED